MVYRCLRRPEDLFLTNGLSVTERQQSGLKYFRNSIWTIRSAAAPSTLGPTTTPGLIGPCSSGRTDCKGGMRRCEQLEEEEDVEFSTL